MEVGLSARQEPPSGPLACKLKWPRTRDVGSARVHQSTRRPYQRLCRQSVVMTLVKLPLRYGCVAASV